MGGVRVLASPRRLAEAAGPIRRARWLAVPFLLLQFGLYQVPASLGTTMPFPRWLAVPLAAVLVATNLASLRVSRSGSLRALRWWAVAETAIDTTMVIALIVLFGFDPTTRLWPLLVVPISEGAVRGGLGGALATWLYGAGGFVVDQLLRLGSRDDPGAWIGSMTFGAGVLLLVALVTGSLAQRLEAATDRAERSAETLRRLRDLAHAMSQTDDPRSTLQLAVRGAVELLGAAAAAAYYHHPDGRWIRVASTGTAGWAEDAPPEGTRALTAATVIPADVVAGVLGPVAHALAVPLTAAGRVLGVLLVGWRRGLDDADLDLVGALAGDTAVALSNLRAAETEARSAEELARLDQVREEFAAVLTHELKGPMAAVLGFARVLRGRWQELDDATRDDLLRRIADGTERLAGLISDVLDAVTAERAGLPIAPVAFDLAALVRSCAEMVTSSRHELVLDLPPGPVTAFADPSRTRRILDNLLSNAVKYSPDGGRITLRAEHRDDTVAVSVEDEGVGIPEEVQPLLFRKFSRLHPELGVAGTGLGLYLARTLAVAMGGDLTVQSRPGRGSTFTLRLPAASADVARQDADHPVAGADQQRPVTVDVEGGAADRS